MKSVLTAFIILFVAISASAQLEKKTWLVGGSGTFNSFKDKFDATTVSTEYKTTDLNIMPNIGYFIVDKFALGVKSSFSWIKNTGISANAGKSNTIRFDYGPFARYYFLDKEKAYNLIADVSYQFGNINFIDHDRGIRNTVALMAGPVMYFNSSVGIEFLIGYRSAMEKITTSPGTPQFFYTQTKTGVQVSIGFQIHLQKR